MASDDTSEEPTRKETLAVLDDEPMTTKAVAEELGVPKQAAYRRLSELAEEGTVEKREKRQRIIWAMLE